MTTPAANPNTGGAIGSAPVETFTVEEVQQAILSFLGYGEAQYGKSHHGYFSGQGFAARALRFHLDRLVSDNRKSEDEPNAPVRRAGTASPPVEGSAPVTYSSTQQTNCAVCGERKHTPLRNDAMGGYVCLTCIDRELVRLQSQNASHERQEPRQ
jgi:hypothetical protein